MKLPFALLITLLSLALTPRVWAGTGPDPPVWGLPSFSLSGNTTNGTPIVLCTSVMPNNTQGWGFYFRKGDSASADKPPSNCAFSIQDRPATVGSGLFWSVGMALSTTKVPMSVTSNGPPGFGPHFTDMGYEFYGYSLVPRDNNQVNIKLIDFQGSPRNGQCLGWTDKAKPGTIQQNGLDGISMVDCDDSKSKWTKGGGYVQSSIENWEG
ncbi:hypothetical protein BJ684DRAFT_14698 [Piptocephalis cylindrospora]|uniref:Uncharacterized protein n=1 Tax=Piptocephalis cylindrospora TaxID=1907219 RepID=A0A4P9Y7G7_9FUNG|nr:hypothetical protein BJ684DRAFT_14698 [Piptocephalis cylindrospora]|eukprot:RKP15018.1 hypothetical protein BJ684DRAFT_14698 [Piptocephalis cylindrospora]